MDVISHVVSAISRGEAVKANGPIEHWLTTLATGFWGFDDSKEGMWSGLQSGDVLIFQAGPPNWDFVEKYKPKPKVSGFIGAGVVDRISKKAEPRWLSEVIESQVHQSASPKLWPNLVHFSNVVWFGDVDGIPASAVQGLIESCESGALDLRLHIQRLAQNNLTFTAMAQAGFTCAPMGTGGRLIKNSGVLAELLQSQAATATLRAYGDSLAPAPAEGPPPDTFDVSGYICVGSGLPTKRLARAAAKSSSRKAPVKNRDYLQEAAVSQELGLVGERIVFEVERKRVLAELGEQYVSRVVHVSQAEGDGAGYDIRTLRKGPAGVVEHYLEVKTTTGDVNTDFFISENEVQCAAAEMDRYEVVRLYSLDQVMREYQEYRLTARDLLDLSRTPVSYRVNVAQGQMGNL